MGAETDYSMVLVNLDGHPDDYWRELGQIGTRVMLDNPMQAADFGRRLWAGVECLVETWKKCTASCFRRYVWKRP